MILCRCMSFLASNLTGDVIEHHPYVLSFPRIKMCIPNQNLDRMKMIQCNKNHQAVATFSPFDVENGPSSQWFETANRQIPLLNVFWTPGSWRIMDVKYTSKRLWLEPKNTVDGLQVIFLFHSDIMFRFQQFVLRYVYVFVNIYIYICILFMNIDLTCSVCTLS